MGQRQKAGLLYKFQQAVIRFTQSQRLLLISTTSQEELIRFRARFCVHFWQKPDSFFDWRNPYRQPAKDLYLIV